MRFEWIRRPPGGATALLERKVAAANAGALEDVAGAARQAARRRTGEYAGSIRAVADGTSGGSVGSPLPQAGAVERGANVGPRRGPHMSGRPAIRPAALQHFGRAFARRFRGGTTR
jgi:hypothetical protein